MRTLALLVSLAFLLLASGCTTSPSPGMITPLPSAGPRYEAGDLLGGDLVEAGFDDPNGTPAGAAIVVLEYQALPGQYVYTLVRPVEGNWMYVYPAGDWTKRLSRERTVFEGYRLEIVGYVQVGRIQPARTTKTVGPA